MAFSYFSKFYFPVTHAPTKFDKVMKREICRITTKGTKTYSYMEGDCCDVSNSYLLSIAEKVSSKLKKEKIDKKKVSHVKLMDGDESKRIHAGRY